MHHEYIPANFLPDIKTVPTSYKMSHFHTHNRWELLYLISGNCTLYIKENMYIIAHNNMSNNKYKYLGSSNLNILFKLI